MVAFNKVLFLTLSAVSVMAQSSANAASGSASANNASPSGTSNNSNSSEAVEMTEIEKCAQKNSCDPTTMECKALCTGVPNPTRAQINDTNNCVANCNQTDAKEYGICSQNCINKHFRKVDIPDASKNGTNSTNGKNGTNGSASSAPNSTGGYSVMGALLATTMFLTYYQL